ncbi:uncharacterized protein TM35_000054440 [Trypanosoma theileri]|uniref:RRM domain-containing protein n=1 Tax=Trypanosoma theileri TaxID=67003 RepID=A0A1X0P4T5_9TRYP|nr:uncharacterized protein TM35_000054440 [Trypanosoma theileri]ORC91848.1 hypothetical protein TM35_000054440 [Trypanosoma theileri]
MSLLEDGRLALYHRFPMGAVLYDPSEFPPCEVPLSTDAAEHGITSRRLIPYGHYEVYLPDDVTGELLPLTGESMCVYVTNLPPNTTAEMLGRYFEAFDMVAEADIFTTASGVCSGRGWVILQDPTKLLLIPPLLEFFPRYFIRTALSDKAPMRTTIQSIPAPGIQILGSIANSYTDPSFNRSRGGNHKRSNGMGGYNNSSASAPKPPAPLTGSVLSTSIYYFVAFIQKSEIEKSVENGVFWPSPANRRAFYSTLDRGPVIIIFVLQECSAIFGYARLLPQRDTNNGGSSACPIEWMKHHIFLQEEDMRYIQSVPIARIGDGIPLKPEIGDSICQLADQFPALTSIPDGLGYHSPNGRHVMRGPAAVAAAAGGGGGAQPVGERDIYLRSSALATPPQPLGVRNLPLRGGGGSSVNSGVNNRSRVPPRRRMYHD